MNAALERLHHVLRLIDDEPALVSDSALADRLDRICRVAVRLLPSDGAGVTMMDRDARPLGTIAASSPLFRRLEDIQFTLGEGPCVEASAARSPVLEEDMRRTGRRRWPAYAASALEEGINAAFAFPVHAGAARLGVLDVYRYREGPLAREALRDALCLARICMTTMLELPVGAPVGEVDAEDGLGDAFPLSPEVYQAQGVVMVQLDVSLAEAMVRLRAHAYASGHPISDVACEVLAGRIVFTREDV